MMVSQLSGYSANRAVRWITVGYVRRTLGFEK